MSRIVYKALLMNNETMKKAESRELAFDKDNGHVYVFDDYKIPISKTEELEKLIDGLEVDKQIKKSKEITDLTTKLCDKWNKIEDYLYGKYRFNYETNKFDYSNSDYNIPSFLEKIEEVYNKTWFYWQKMDYGRCIYEYNNYNYNLLLDEVNKLSSRCDFLLKNVNDLNVKYESIRGITVDLDFYDKIDISVNGMIKDVTDMKNDLPNKLRQPGSISGNVSVSVNTKVKKVHPEYGFFRWMSSNSVTYPGNYNKPGGGWYNFNASACPSDGENWYGTKPEHIVINGKWVIYNRRADDPNFNLNKPPAGTPRFTYPVPPFYSYDPAYPNYTKYRPIRTEWCEMNPENWGKYYPDYDPSIDYMNPPVRSSRKVPLMDTTNVESTRYQIKIGDYTIKDGFYSYYGIWQQYGRSARITFKVESEINESKNVIHYF